MCLSIINNKIKFRKEHGHLVGWKAFSYSFPGHHLKALYFGGDKRYPIGKWVNEKDYREACSEETIALYREVGRYKTGFHIMSRQDDAISWGGTIRKVHFRKVAAKGYQGGASVFVAKEMRILSRKEEKR